MLYFKNFGSNPFCVGIHNALNFEKKRVLKDQSTCIDRNAPKQRNYDPSKNELCVGPKFRTETFLKVYNCDYIRPPKPDRFARAQKQIYRPDHVLHHYVHYSTVTRNDIQQPQPTTGIQPPRRGERFVKELTEGALIHARSILPHETRLKSSQCYLGSKYTCQLGYLCDDSVPFRDAIHKDNKFFNTVTTNSSTHGVTTGKQFCNCWRNPVVDDTLVPELQRRLDQRRATVRSQHQEKELGFIL